MIVTNDDEHLMHAVNALALRMGLLEVLAAIEVGGAIALPGGEQRYHPPPRTQGPCSVAEYRQRAAGDLSLLRGLSDDELVQELEDARGYEAWVTDPGRWLRCWDHRAVVIGRYAIMAVVAAYPDAASTP